MGMESKTYLLLFAWLLAAQVGMAAAADKPKLIAFKADARVMVDATGKPTQVEASRNLPEPIREYIEKRVSAWSFEPPQRDGQGGAGVTYVHLGACAAQIEEGYSLAIDYKGNGPGYGNDYGMRLPPRYPTAASVAGQEATIRVTYVVEADGRVKLEDREYVGDGRPSGHVRKAFDDAIRDWTKQLRYRPEELAGNPVRTRLTVPVDFKLSDNPRAASLAQFRQTAIDSDECRMASDQQQGLVPIAENSPFKLISQGG